MPVVAHPPRRVRYALDRTLTHRLHTLTKLLDRQTHHAFVASVGLPLGEARCLAAVGAFAPLSVKHLAQHANLNKGQASRAAQSLVDQGLVHKEESDNDGRAVVLALTDRGEQVWPRLIALIERRNDDIFGCLSAIEREAFAKVLDRLADHHQAPGRTAQDAARTDPPDAG